MEEFYTLSLITITVAGFSALFQVLKPRGKQWTYLDKVNLIRFYIMVELASLLTIFSFLPVVLLSFLDFETGYKLSFGICFLVFAMYYLFAVTRNRRLTRKVIISGLPTIIILIAGAVVLALSLLGFLDVLGGNHKANYLLILYLFFLVNIYLFIRLIYFTVRKE